MKKVARMRKIVRFVYILY